MIPMKLAANDGYVGFEYVPSFGISCLILNLILLYSVAVIQHTPIRWDVKVSIPPTFASGLFWSIGNIGGILASLSPLGQTTGFPLTQVGFPGPCLNTLRGEVYHWCGSRTGRRADRGSPRDCGVQRSHCPV